MATLESYFSHELLYTIGECRWLEVVRRNALPEYAGVCASHDFCDANMVMADAWEQFMGRQFLPDNATPSDADMDLWNKAWADAKANWQRLVDCGFLPEQSGGGILIMSRYRGEGRRWIWATDADGSGIPSDEDYLINIYPAEWDGEELDHAHMFSSKNGMALDEALAKACAIADEGKGNG